MFLGSSRRQDEAYSCQRQKNEAHCPQEQRDRYRKYFGLAVVIIILLTLSTFAACWCASELSKEVHADHAALADATGTILGVSPAFASVPLYVLAAMPMEALGRVRAISVSYVDGGEQAQLQMEIVQRGKKGSTVELVDALGYTVRLEGTSAARLIVPSGAEFVVCESDASCSSVTVNNDDLQLYEAQAFELWENETAAENEAGRRLDVAERRRLAQRSLSSGPGCNGEEEEDGLTAIIASSAFGGDSYELLTMGLRVFTVYHHERPAKLVCLRLDTGAICENFPYPWTPNPQISSPNRPTGYVDSENERLYIAMEQGLLCLHVPEGIAPALCDIYAPLVIGWSSFGDYGNGDADYEAQRWYGVFTSGSVVCVDLSDPENVNACPGFPVTIRASSSLQVQVMPKSSRILAGGMAVVQCIDTALSPPGPCEGWPTNGGPPGGKGAIIPIMDEDGITVEFCPVGVGGISLCYDLATAERLTAGTEEVLSVITHGEGWQLSKATHGTRTYWLSWPSGSVWVNCFDGQTRGFCENFPRVFPITSNPSWGGWLFYRIKVEFDGACILGVGCSGAMHAFSTDDPNESCRVSASSNLDDDAGEDLEFGQ